MPRILPVAAPRDVEEDDREVDVEDEDGSHEADEEEDVGDGNGRLRNPNLLPTCALPPPLPLLESVLWR